MIRVTFNDFITNSLTKKEYSSAVEAEFVYYGNQVIAHINAPVSEDSADLDTIAWFNAGHIINIEKV